MNPTRQQFAQRLDLEHGRVELSHGGGGRAMAQLIEELFLAAFDNAWLREQDDGARLPDCTGRLVMATDSHVVSPLFFPGGDIGCLAVHGTLNDVAMTGAQPLYLAAAFILEEGLPLADLKKIVNSMAEASRQAGVPIVTGDTKVVERGKGDGVFITTTGIGVIPPGVEIAASRATPGDVILISGALGDHGMAVLAQRENLHFQTPIRSDTAALHGLVAALVQAAPGIHCLRDLTRGGLGSALNEIARQSGVGMRLREAAIPVHEPVRALGELLGLDPLYIANEGKLLAICPAELGQTALATLQHHPLGQEAAIIGRVVADDHCFVEMATVFSGRRLVDWLSSEPLPRIC